MPRVGGSTICLSVSCQHISDLLSLLYFFKAMQWMGSSKVQWTEKKLLLQALTTAYLTAAPFLMVCYPGYKNKAIAKLFSDSAARVPFALYMSLTLFKQTNSLENWHTMALKIFFTGMKLVLLSL